MSYDVGQKSFIIKDVMVINGKGTPPYGPCDILIENNKIKDIVNVDTISLTRYKTKRPEADKVIEAKGKYVIPGLVDMHIHINIDDDKCGPRGAEYAYKLCLAHGITTIRTCGFGTDEKLLEHKRLSEENKIAAPRIMVLGSWPAEAHNVEESIEAVRRFKEMGVNGIKMIPRPHVTAEMIKAIADETRRVGLAGGIAIHHAQNSELDALITSDAAKEMLTIEHTYGIPQAALPGTQNFPADYNYSNEVDRFRMSGYIWTEADQYPERVKQVFDKLLENETVWDPTMVVYEGHRDYERVKTLPWHEAYTVRQLWEAYSPSPGRHATHFFNWKTSDEIAWKRKYQIWMKWIKYFFDNGGTLVAGSDTAFIYALFGFALIRELELFQEAGIHPIDIIKIATTNAHKTLGNIELSNGIRKDAPADLAIIDGNPLDNFKVMYGTGIQSYSEEGLSITQRGGVQWSIKNGIIFDCKKLLHEVRDYVESQKGE
jgi:cytosine/adenosine deaminase-related metal-dependent hydrolase